MIAVVDYQVGNRGNVRRAFESFGEEVLLALRPEQLTEEISLAVLPGVGAFGPASENLFSTGWAERLREWHGGGRPLLGICLGMQLLCEEGHEEGKWPGLGLISGAVLPLQARKIPHMGWNSVDWAGSPADFTPSLQSGEYFYFVHSYALFDSSGAAGTTTLEGRTFTSMVLRGRTAGFQFHPERSGTAGLSLLKETADYLRRGDL